MAKKTNRKGTGPKRSKKQREADFVRLADMYVRSYKQADIAEALGVSRAMVSLEIKELHRRWRESTTLSMDDYKIKELEKLDELEREYWASWENSKKGRKKQKRRLDYRGETKEQEQEESCGDPRYLDGVHKCISLRVDVLGLKAPQKTEAKIEGLADLMQAYIDGSSG